MLVAAAFFYSGYRAAAQTLISDFSDLQGDGTLTFLDTWFQAPDAQYTQNVGYITIEPVGGNGGNPASAGSFQVAGVSFDLTTYGSVQISAREDSGNAVSTFNVVFYNGVGANLGPSQQFTFTSSDFSGGAFVQHSISLSSPSLTDPGFDPTAVTHWSLEGDYSNDPGPSFRMSFDNLQFLPVPEPSTWALLGLGGAVIWLRRKRRAC